jgi:hypothetical protein
MLLCLGAVPASVESVELLVPGPRLEVGTEPLGIVAGDFSADGRPDLAVSNAGSGDISVLLGLGDGTFVPQERGEAGSGPHTLALGNFDGDGAQDLAVTNHLSYDLSVLLGRDNGTFDLLPRMEAGANPSSVVAADLDGDGRVDLAVANSGSNDISLFFGNGDGAFQPQERVAAGDIPVSAAKGDFDADGRLDLAGPFPNRPPVAKVRAPERAECTSPAGAVILLDGSESTDPDSVDGADEIVSFVWLIDLGAPEPAVLRGGDLLEVTLAVGGHRVGLRVTDSRGASMAQWVLIDVVDTIPPALTAAVDPPFLWPPDGRMVQVRAAVTAFDACDPEPVVLLSSIRNSEAGQATGAGGRRSLPDVGGALVGTLDLGFDLRAARAGPGQGRFCTVTYMASDRRGNAVTAESRVAVPHHPAVDSSKIDD